MLMLEINYLFQKMVMLQYMLLKKILMLSELNRRNHVSILTDNL